jgi:hypothetical protein
MAAWASTAKETNQAPPWMRYIEDQRDAHEDWGQRSHEWCGRTMGAPLGAPSGWNIVQMHVHVCISVMLVSGHDSTRSVRDRARYVHDHGESKEYS